MDERGRRVGENEALFRGVNEKLEDLNEGVAFITDTFSIICECADLTCADRIELTQDDYTRLRSEPTRFAIIHGHLAVGTEDVVESHEAYDIVRKREGAPAHFAEESAPSGSAISQPS